MNNPLHTCTDISKLIVIETGKDAKYMQWSLLLQLQHLALWPGVLNSTVTLILSLLYWWLNTHYCYNYKHTYMYMYAG